MEENHVNSYKDYYFLDKGIKVHKTAVIYPNVTIRPRVYIGPNCIIGAPPEHKKHWPSAGKGVEIGENTVITGNVTIDSGIDNITYIGSYSFLMKGVYIGHDCALGSDVIISPNVTLAGYVIIDQKVNMGMGSIVHQFCEVPHGCMIGMGTIITKSSKLKPNGCYVGNPAKYLRENKKP